MYYDLIENVKQWFVDRELDKLDGTGQLNKLDEELAELFSAKKEIDEIDAIGDVAVVLIGYCMQRHLPIQHILKTDTLFFKVDPHSILNEFHDKAMELSKLHRENGDKTVEKLLVKTMFTLLYTYCYVRNHNFWYCLNYAYNQIKNRTGRKIGGVFVKEEDL